MKKLQSIDSAFNKASCLRSAQERTTQRSRVRRCSSWYLFLVGLLATGLLQAAVYDTVITDVTTRAFSVAWVSDEAVDDATVRVYADADGLDELTADLTTSVPSANVVFAHDQGIVKVDVTGLVADTTVYVQTETMTPSGNVLYPQTPPYLPVRTALATRKANATDAPIVNDLITHDVLTPDGLSAAEGALLLVSVPTVSDYPVSAFVGDGFLLPAAVTDLNNLFEAATGVSVDFAGGEVLRLSEYRGLRCPINAQELLRFRRVPVHAETPPITSLEMAGSCFTGADFNCDGCVDPIDFNEFLIKFGLVNEPPDCRFNTDFDLSPNNSIDPVDFNELLMVFGVCE